MVRPSLPLLRPILRLSDDTVRLPGRDNAVIGIWVVLGGGCTAAAAVLYSESLLWLLMLWPGLAFLTMAVIYLTCPVVRGANAALQHADLHAQHTHAAGRGEDYDERRFIRTAVPARPARPVPLPLRDARLLAYPTRHH